jgi:uncharacterized LabA/DUF88 family protein
VAVLELLPKASSGAFKELLARTQRVLDLPRLGFVLESALDRKQLEEVLRKALRGGALRPGQTTRPQLVAAVATAFLEHPRGAWLTMRMLDKSCHKERHIVGSMDEESLEVRLSSYRAIDFRRERARLVWALVRDGRQAHEAAAERILEEAFEAMQQAAAEQEAVERGEPDAEALTKRVEIYEAAIREQGELLERERGEKERSEKERSELLAKVGMKERAYKEERQRRLELEEEVKRLRADMRGLEEELERVDPEQVKSALEERDRLREKARSLERQAERATRLRALDEENAALRAGLAELRAEAEQASKEHEDLVEQMASRERAALDRVSSLRAALKTARTLSVPSGDPSLEGEPVAERVGVFLDAANLAASARREHGGKLDFRTLLPELVGGRKKTMAIAFVVDNDDADSQGFVGFTRALLAAGYEVRQKKPRVRSDGSRKADWDMGIAMEIIAARNRLDVVVLGSGDGDFGPLVQRLKQWGKRVEVAAFESSTERELMRVADEFVRLDGRFRVTD